MKLCAIPKPKLLNTWSHVNAAMANFLTQWNSVRKQNIKENRLFSTKVNDGATIKELCKNSGKYVKR